MMECHFAKLPLELVLQITKCLPTDSSYCLALTTKSLFHTPEIRRLGDMDTKWTKHRRRELLPLLARDWPDQTFCDYCANVHPRRDTSKVCKDWQRWSSCPRTTPGMWLHLDPWDYHIQFEDVYKVMESHRLGRDDLHSIALHTDWQVMDSEDMAALDCKANHEGIGNLEKFKNINKGCLKKLDVVPVILDDSLIMTTTQRMFYHAEQRDELFNNGIGRHVFRPCSHWNWSPGMPGGRYLQQNMPSVEDLVTGVIHKKSTTMASRNKLCLYAESFIPIMCYFCSTQYTLRVWNHGNLGIELSLETWTKLGSCTTSEDMWWLTAAYHTCDIYSRYFCERKRQELPLGYDTRAVRFDFLLEQSTTAVLDASFLYAFKDMCSKGGFTDSSATAPDNYAIRTTEWRRKVPQPERCDMCNKLVRGCEQRTSTGQHVKKQLKQKNQQTEQETVETNFDPRYKKKTDKYEKKAEQYQKKTEQTEQRHKGKGFSWRGFKLLQKMKLPRVQKYVTRHYKNA